MAGNKNLVYTITINDNATAVISKVNGQFLKTAVSVDNLDKELLELNGTLSMSTNQFNAQINKLTQLQNGVAIGSQRYNELGNAITSLNTKQQALIGSGSTGLTGVSAATGSASASVLEMGRVISDSNYGIRGVANNLSQLASNMVYTTKAAGGLGAGLKAIGSAMAGPLGILLLFQGAIALLEKWSMANEGAKDSTEELTDKIKEQNEALEENIRLRKIQLEQITGLINSSQIAELFSGIFTSGIQESEKYEAALTELADRLQKIGSKEAKYLKDANILQSDRILIAGNLVAIEKQKTKLLEERLVVDKRIKSIDDIKKEFTDGEITKAQETRKLEDVGIINLNKTIAIQKEINRLKQANLGIIAKTVEIEADDSSTKGKGKGKKEFFGGGYFDEDFEARIEAYKKRYKEYTEDVRAIESEIDIASFAEQNGGSFKGQSTLIDMEMNEELARVDFLIGLRKEENDAYADLEAEQTLIKKNAQIARNEIDRLEVENKRQMFENIGSILSSASQLAGKHTAVGKGLAVASTTISTYNAAQKAYESQMQLTPDSPIRAQIAAGVAIAKGLANVKAILAVKVPNQASIGGAPANRGRTFDFNLAGSTGQNQLAQTIGGQVQQPIKAYVVSSEITNQQQFDNQIQGEVTIG